jgi:hypothetical protein
MHTYLHEGPVVSLWLFDAREQIRNDALEQYKIFREKLGPIDIEERTPVCMCMRVCVYACIQIRHGAFVRFIRLLERKYVPIMIGIKNCMDVTKADCVRVGRQRSRAKGTPVVSRENCVLRVAQTWLNGIFPLPREFCGQLKRKQLYVGILSMYAHKRYIQHVCLCTHTHGTECICMTYIHIHALT